MYHHADSEERLLGRLGVTYGTLKQLGYSDDRIDECLQAIDDITYEDALDWVCYIDSQLCKRTHVFMYSFSYILRSKRR